VCLILNFLLWTYVLQWQILITICLTWIEAGLVLIGAIVLTVLNVWSDADEERLTRGFTGKLTYQGLANAKRSRVNAAADLSILLSGLLFLLFEVSLVMLYCLGGTSQSWLNGVQTVVNYPLTNTTAYPTITGRVINQVNYRSGIHFFIFIKALILLTSVIFSRGAAQALHVSVLQIEHARRAQKASDETEADSETAAHMAVIAPKAVNAGRPLGGQLVYTNA
jgi:hypothetical protein